jgi:two-component sensor histidine kinase
MLGYESLKELSLPSLTKWGSHFVTVAFAGLSAGIVGYLVSKRLREVNARLREENLERERAERAATVSLEEKASLLRELHHRVKNSFAMIDGIIRLSAEDVASEDGSRVLAEVEARVSAISEMYDLLYSSGSTNEVELGGYIERIARLLSTRSGATLRLELARCAISADVAVLVGLIVAELTTNAIKYAFPDGRPGTVTIRTSRDGDRLDLGFDDDGVGMPAGLDPAKTGTMGLKIIVSLVAQLSGTWRLEPGAGTRWRLGFPLGARPSP